MRLLIKNAKVYNKDYNGEIVDLFIDYGEIIEIGKNIQTEVPEVINAKGKTLLPGLIDINCKICDPGFEYMEDINSISKSGAKGGFTTLVASPDTNPVIDEKTVVKYIETKSRKESLINILQLGGMTEGLKGIEIAEIGEMKKAGIVGISDGGTSLKDANLLSNILKYSIMFDLPVITHCDDMDISSTGVMNNGQVSLELGLKGISHEAEEIIVARNVILAKSLGAKIHLSNITTKGSVNIIRYAKAEGVKITCDTCPHYFTLSEKDVRDYNTLAKVRPPLRTEEDIESLIEGLFDGTIDMITSGHSPTTIEQKKVEFEKAFYGISSLETTFLTSYNCLVEKYKMKFYDFIQKFTIHPANFLNIEGKGKVEEGYEADLFLFDEKCDTIIDSSSFASKAKFSPFNGVEYKGKVLFTIVSGNIMYLQDY